ncbi:MAG: plastocyanin [Pseudanabaenaceae cyanobacterium bins.68]|nr:plastocyanin [Pseudanabaenaceae cyanobacterium bins.68]
MISNTLSQLKRFSLICCALLVAFTLSFSAAANAETYQVKMGSDSGQLVFEPKVVTIKAGDTVQWVNNKAFPHNIIFEGNPDLSHKKLLLKPKLNAETTFTQAGEFSYYCTPHRGAGMVGKVVVTE